jgi:ribonuclease HI
MTADEIPTLESMITSWKENINNETHRPLPSKQFQQAAPAKQLPTTPPAQQNSTDIETFINSLRTPKQLKFTNCRTIYADGSKTATNLSAGVYDPVMGIHHIRIRSQGPSMHTAMRAELKAIHSALQTITLITQTNTLLTADAAGNIVNNNTPQPAPPPENIIILTDSQSSMHLIHTMLHYPNKLRYHKHKFLLKTIANHLLLGTQENRQSFTFCKVKAHVGIKGNEIADTAATNPEKIDNIFMDEDHPNHFCDLPNSKPTWVKLQDKQQPLQWRQANNMTEIKDAIATTSIEHLMQHNKSKKIQDLLDDDKELEQKHNTKLITTIMANQRIPQPHRSLAFKLRMRNLYTTQLAADMNQASTSTAAVEQQHFCTICTSHKKETQGHILGGCTHPDMHSQHMKRHGKGAGLILQTIRDNTNVATFADAETVEKSLQKISSTFLPRSRQVETNKHKMISKPDIITFPELTQDQTNTAPEHDEKKAIFLEISFTGDGDAAQRFQQKVTQHAAHAQFLETNQWTIEVVPIIITHSGCITDNLTTTLTNLGISNGQVKKLITKLQAHVCASNYTIIKTFRFFKRQQADRRSGVG